jgi:hypothetical protein
MMTSTDKSLVLEMERTLLKKYGQFRTSSEKTVSYLGYTWDFHEKGIVKVSQTGMIQDLVASREKFRKDRGTEFTGKPRYYNITFSTTVRLSTRLNATDIGGVLGYM